VQEIAHKNGALALCKQFVEEKEERNQIAVLGALSAFLRGTYLDGKKEFIDKIDGLMFLKAILTERSSSIAILKKTLFLLLDLVTNDQEGKIKERLSQDQVFIDKLKETVRLEISDRKNLDARIFALQIIGRLISFKKEKMKAEFEGVLVEHKQELEKHEGEHLEEEMKMNQEALEAHTFDYKQNIDNAGEKQPPVMAIKE